MTAGPAKMRTTIVDTTYHYACKHGLSSLSIRTIAKECSVSVGSIYNYFPDKAALVTKALRNRYCPTCLFYMAKYLSGASK